MKRCSKCKIFKELDQFNKDSSKADGFNWWCRECSRQNSKEFRATLKKIKPWHNSFSNARKRCNNIKHNSYLYYDERGIKFLITEGEVKKLWFRDKGYLLKRPSIDRKDNDGHYTYENCQFIELSENSKKSNINRKNKKTILNFKTVSSQHSNKNKKV